MPALRFVNAHAAAHKDAFIEGGVLSTADAAFISPSTGAEVQSVEASVSLAELNAGKVILAAIPGQTYRIVGVLMLINGTFTTATDIRLSDTAASPVDILTLAIAGATNGARIGNTSTTNVTWGSFGQVLTADQGVQLRKTGSNAAGGTSIVVNLLYKIH